jgi:hypothetical protein
LTEFLEYICTHVFSAGYITAGTGFVTSDGLTATNHRPGYRLAMRCTTGTDFPERVLGSTGISIARRPHTTRGLGFFLPGTSLTAFLVT